MCLRVWSSSGTRGQRLPQEKGAASLSHPRPTSTQHAAALLMSASPQTGRTRSANIKALIYNSSDLRTHTHTYKEPTFLHLSALLRDALKISSLTHEHHLIPAASLVLPALHTRPQAEFSRCHIRKWLHFSCRSCRKSAFPTCTLPMMSAAALRTLKKRATEERKRKVRVFGC